SRRREPIPPFLRIRPERGDGQKASRAEDLLGGDERLPPGIARAPQGLRLRGGHAPLREPAHGLPASTAPRRQGPKGRPRLEEARNPGSAASLFSGLGDQRPRQRAAAAQRKGLPLPNDSAKGLRSGGGPSRWGGPRRLLWTRARPPSGPMKK